MANHLSSRIRGRITRLYSVETSCRSIVARSVAAPGTLAGQQAAGDGTARYDGRSRDARPPPQARLRSQNPNSTRPFSVRSQTSSIPTNSDEAAWTEYDRPANLVEPESGWKIFRRLAR